MSRLLALLFLALITACAARPPRVAQSGWPPLAPATLGADRTVTQVLRAAFADREMTFNCVVKVDRERVTLVALSAIGERLFTLTFDGTKYDVQSAASVPAALQPERLLDDLQLAFWDLSTLQAALAGTPWQVTEPFAHTRRLKRAGQLVAEVHYLDSDPWTGRLWLVNFAARYSLSIDSRASVE